MNNKKIAFFEGSHFEIGKELGRWWVDKVTCCRQKTAYKSQLESNKTWNKAWFPLLDYAYKNFPEIMDEIAGMTEGINDKGWKTNIGNVFVHTTGEVWGCSSVLIPIKGDGFLLGHNEEDDLAYPLCFAEVHLNEADGNHKFISVSYPFQLFGSVAGMNRSMAFQGNSIGTVDSDLVERDWLENSWNNRAPKTFFTRRMLECHDIAAIERLFDSHHAALPSHHFVAFKNKAYSLKVRPFKITKTNNLKMSGQLEIEAFSKDTTIHTNHFIGDEDWKWGGSDDDNSETRLSSLQNIIEEKKLNEPEDLLKELEKFKNDPDNDVETSTSASLCFKITSKSSSLDALAYFGEHESQKSFPTKISSEL